MDKPRRVPIRRRSAQNSSSSVASSSSNVEGTFIPLAASDSQWTGLDFVNPKFYDEEEDDETEEDVLNVIELQTEERPPLFLLFPDLENEKDRKRLSASTSTSQVTRLLIGKKADFSLLKPSKKLTGPESRLPPLIESSQEMIGQETEKAK